uniref:AGC-kinase C-terminal domain-containing protein n=2 Tax=Caenorhabditis tropicalis TaxID=1561998 RepID=A0A1I7TFX5_9PELO
MCTWEMMLLSALCSYCLRPAKCKFFDLYPGNDVVATTAHDTTSSRLPSFSRRDFYAVEYEPRIAGVILEPPLRTSQEISAELNKINTDDSTAPVSHFDDNFDSLSQI